MLSLGRKFRLGAGEIKLRELRQRRRSDCFTAGSGPSGGISVGN